VLIDDFRTAAVQAGVLSSAFRRKDLRQMVDIYAVNSRAGDLYQPEPYPGEVRCSFTNHDSVDNYVDEWRRYATGKVTVDVVEADHFSLMHEQNAAHVASVLTS
jgi:thioesterase domain-containing protein